MTDLLLYSAHQK